ncbi:MAG: hypothetical protein OXR71_05850 [Gemmatimonadota bacterium]|nr:hypothetical protein [Gemmatimonadota bacterium]
MERIVDPKYRFAFSFRTDQPYYRKCYWENLYVFTYGTDRVLVATRVVPFTSLHEALYTAFKGQRGNTLTQHLLPEAIQQPHLNVFNNKSQVQIFADNISALVPEQNAELPEELIEKKEAEIEEAASRIMIRQGIEGGLGSFASGETTPFLARDEPDDPSRSIVREDDEDAALIQMSVQIDAAIKKHIRESGEGAFDIAARLYTNPRYLGFVRRLINAKGSYTSPVVRDFLKFYARCFNTKISEHLRQSKDDPDILRQRIESLLGREKGGRYHYLNYHDLTILGRVVKGELEPDPDDPDKTTHCFKLSNTIDAQTLRLSEIHDPVQRFAIRKFVEHTFNARHNIKNIQYIDEISRRKIPFVQHLPDPIERALRSGIETLENYLDHLEPQMLQIAIGALLLSLLGVVALALGTFIGLAR